MRGHRGTGKIGEIGVGKRMAGTGTAPPVAGFVLRSSGYYARGRVYSGGGKPNDDIL